MKTNFFFVQASKLYFSWIKWLWSKKLRSTCIARPYIINITQAKGLSFWEIHGLRHVMSTELTAFGQDSSI